jgi:uncharacterized ParB-like nuclease family protein
MDINKVIDIVRYLREETGPTMNLGSGQIAGTVEAGDNPPVDLRKKGTKGWNIYFKNQIKKNRKK